MPKRHIERSTVEPLALTLQGKTGKYDHSIFFPCQCDSIRAKLFFIMSPIETITGCILNVITCGFKFLKRRGDIIAVYLAASIALYPRLLCKLTKNRIALILRERKQQLVL